MSKRSRHMRKTCWAKRFRRALKALVAQYPSVPPHKLKKMAEWQVRNTARGWKAVGSWSISLALKELAPPVVGIEPQWSDVTMQHTDVTFSSVTYVEDEYVKLMKGREARSSKYIVLSGDDLEE